MTTLLSIPSESIRIQQILLSLLLIMLGIMLRRLLSRLIAAMSFRTEDSRRRTLLQLRNLVWVMVGMVCVAVWAEEIRGLALSAAAIGLVAFIIGMKELILCMLGGIYKMCAFLFHIGDRIEIDGIRGDVIDFNLLSTTVLEVGPNAMIHQNTGRAVKLPNMMFLTKALTCEAMASDYLFHTFTVPLERNDDWQKHEATLMSAAQTICEPFLAAARVDLEACSKEQALKSPRVEPRIWVHIPTPKELLLCVRVPAPAFRRGNVEQDILRYYLTHLPKPPETPTPPEAS